jgi:hypothetical protein
VSKKLHLIATCVLAIASIVLLISLVYSFDQHAALQSEIRYANDITLMFEDRSRDARKAGVSEAADILWQLHFPSFQWDGKPEPFHGFVARLVERERRGRVRDVINCLRFKTGEDLGDDPEPWIMKYGSEDSRGSLSSMKESAGHIPKVQGSNQALLAPR